MATVKVDSEGVPYWDQIQDTRLDYTVDWGNWLPTGDSVVSSHWSVTPTGLSVTSGAHTASGLHTGWISPSAGNTGVEYLLVSKIFTSDTRENKQKLKIKVQG